jgi:uncharacterized protein (TIGR02147 family)
MIFQFSSYRDYLKAHLKQLPKQGYGESKRMAEELSVSSTYMSQVFSGIKELSPEQTTVLSEYLGHSKLESEYFFYLVQKERAGTHKFKKFCEQKLSEIVEQSRKLSERVSYKKELTEEQKSIFYSNAVYSAVHLFTSTGKNGRTIDEIAERFELSRAKASEIIRFLAETGLCSEDSGRYSMGTQSTHVGTGSPHLLKHHANWRIRAIQASEDLDSKELMYTVNVSLSEKDFEVLREEMVEYIDKFLKRIYPSPAEEIACFNMDFFWIRK